MRFPVSKWDWCGSAGPGGGAGSPRLPLAARARPSVPGFTSLRASDPPLGPGESSPAPGRGEAGACGVPAAPRRLTAGVMRDAAAEEQP